MKKLLFAAMVLAGTTLGFAKDNVQNSKSTHTESSQVESNVEKPQTIYQFDTLEEAQKFLAECTDLVVVTREVDGKTEILSTHESTVPCILRPEGTVNVFVISA
jgi:hypothetical protein